MGMQKNENNGFYDSVGGYHEGGCGYGPDGIFCGECGESTCGNCTVYQRRTEDA